MKTTSILLTGLVCIFLFAGSAFAQYGIPNYDGAYTITPGKVEVSSHYTILNWDEPVSNTIGVRLGVGIHQMFDFKIQYNHFFFKQENQFDVIQFIPRVTGKDGKVSFMVPFGLMMERRYSYYNGETTIEKMFFFSPRIKGTIPIKNIAEINITPLAEIYTDEGYVSYSLGLNLGCGFSSDFSKWALRPELGIISNPCGCLGGFMWNAGIGATYCIGF